MTGDSPGLPVRVRYRMAEARKTCRQVWKLSASIAKDGDE